MPSPSLVAPAPDLNVEIELSIVVPVYGEADNIGPLCDRLLPLLRRIVSSYEVLFIDDGSKDETLAAIRRQNEERDQ